ncbi:MAG: DNA recombination protein RmuC [Clostridiales bacterium]|nr:DNA recombination protein RmuC [Clostridiales bacterium]MDD7035992.1 DNA recombination protein RmuC [Bacillota bacterium]MDY2921115.1 DNA recombination protein RmuC [Lentihominibacter sp.]
MMAGVLAAAAVVIVCMVLCFVLIRISLKDSISSLGDMISRNQQTAALSQNETINTMNTQLNAAMVQVSESLGEMKSLAGGVEDLKKVISNVKTRGILGELQLGAILEDILAPDQYEENVAVKGGSERVEFAVKFPSDDGNFVYLPIDSKFPGDAYLNLLDARELGDRRLEKEMTDGLRKAVIKGARDIHDKYIYPPLTTDFAVMFLPFEGLYSEVLRLNIMEKLQRDFRVTVAGPTTMAALLSSLRMGFRTIALRERADEVWDTLEKVKTEFEKFEDTLVRTQSRLEQTQKELELLVGVRTRSIRKALNGIGEAEVREEE